MDEASKSATRFLEVLQKGREHLTRTLYNGLIENGAVSAPHFLTLSRKPYRVQTQEKVVEYSGAVVLGITAQFEAREPIEFAISVIWNAEGWVITTEVSVYCENGTQILREFAERSAISLDECVAQLQMAIIDLSICADIIKDAEC